ncbi:hypothetical protein BDW69DRAFT_39280 [Aspergillus filifer]
MIAPRLAEADPRTHLQTIWTQPPIQDPRRAFGAPCKIYCLRSAQITSFVLSWKLSLACFTDFIRILQQVIPVEDVHDESVSVGAKPASPDSTRPAFSLPVMGNNFRRFNAR